MQQMYVGDQKEQSPYVEHFHLNKALPPNNWLA